MMIKIKYGFAFLIVILAVVTSCKKDDGGDPDVIPPRPRGPEAVREQALIEEFLETHFYNYEEFQNPPVDFDYVVKFDTIAGDNASKTPLMTQVDSKEVKDHIDDDVTYKMYFLNVRQGLGDKPNFPDIVTANYDGRLMNLDLFDSSVIPVNFDLTDNLITGFREAFIEFNGAGTVVSNPDGTVSFEDYGIGAVFIPSGLGYYNYPPGNTGLGQYEQLIFSFHLYSTQLSDQDEDGVPSYMEDINNNQFEKDDDTDEDGIANYIDVDDDNDGRLTRDEIEIDANGNITFPDTDGDGTPDYLDENY